MLSVAHFRDNKRRYGEMRWSPGSECMERLSGFSRALAKSNQITLWTRRKSCHPSSRDGVKNSLKSLPLSSVAGFLLLLHLHFNIFPHIFPQMTSAASLHWLRSKQCWMSASFFYSLLKTCSECHHVGAAKMNIRTLGLLRAAHLNANDSPLFLMFMNAVQALYDKCESDTELWMAWFTFHK